VHNSSDLYVQIIPSAQTCKGKGKLCSYISREDFSHLHLFYFILFYFILFYFILFYFILFYFILYYFIHFWVGQGEKGLSICRAVLKT